MSECVYEALNIAWLSEHVVSPSGNSMGWAEFSSCLPDAVHTWRKYQVEASSSSVTFISDVSFLITKSLRRHWFAHLQGGKSGQSLDVSSTFDFDLAVVIPLTTGAIVWERFGLPTRLKGWTCKAVTAGFYLEGFQVTVVVNFAIEMVVTVTGLFGQNNMIS